MIGKRIFRISIHRSSSLIVCKITLRTTNPRADSEKTYRTELDLKQYGHMADIVNQAVRSGHGTVHAHTIMAGFVWMDCN